MADIQTLINKLYHPDGAVREANGAAGLRSLGGESLEALIAVLNRTYPIPNDKRTTGLLNLGNGPRQRESEARCLAAGLLGQLGDDRAAEALLAALTTEDVRVRDSAALALGRRGDARALEPLIAALQNRDADIRSEAVGLLGKLGDRRAVEPLIHTMQTDGRSAPRWMAMRVLGDLGDGRAVRPLIQVLEGLLTLSPLEWAAPQPEEHREETSSQRVWTTCSLALDALSKLNDPAALPVVERLARDVPAHSIASKARRCAAKLRYGHTE
jgi:hypothetical protein